MNFVFIGDECPLADLPKDFTYKSKEIQQNRKNDELRIRYVLLDKLYQDYANNNSYIKPDFVVALDCGFKFYPSWKKAIPQMVCISSMSEKCSNEYLCRLFRRFFCNLAKESKLDFIMI